MKLAKVIPVFKKGDQNNCNNYRPISVLPIFSKIVERIVYNRLYSFLSQNNILCCNQYGFRSNYSVEFALINLHDNILNFIDKKLKCSCNIHGFIQSF